jgi:flagellar hook-associated protein 3 FlgL
MRIADDNKYSSLLQDIQRIAQRMQTAQTQASSGKKLNRPSDNPSGAADVVNIDSARATGAQYLDNAATAQSRLEVADSSLDGVQLVTDRIRTLALGALSGSPSTSSSEEISGLRDQILSYANSAFEGQYIFAGSNTDSPAYAKASDGTITYSGNSDVTRLQTGKASTLQSQIPGSDVFSAGIDIFKTVSDLAAAMNSGDKNGIQTQVGKLEQFSQAVSTSRTKVGGLINASTAAQTDLKQTDLTQIAHLSHVQDVDLAKALSDFSQSQTALQAATAVAGRVSSISILDYLK